MQYSNRAGGLQLSLRFLLLGRHLPAAPHSWAATPIIPAPEHPETGRRAVDLGKPLPWSECYVHSLSAFNAFVSRIYQHPIAGPAFSDDEHDELRFCVGTDNKRRTRALNEAQAEAQRHELLRNKSDDRSSDDDQSVEPTTGDRDLGDILPRVDCDPGMEMRLHVELWVNIESIDVPGDPANIRTEISRLQQYVAVNYA